MAKMVLLQEASNVTGLSQWELRTGALSGKYPAMRIGGSRGKIVFDLDMLWEHIRSMMLENIKPKESEDIVINGIRVVK